MVVDKMARSVVCFRRRVFELIGWSSLMTYSRSGRNAKWRSVWSDRDLVLCIAPCGSNESARKVVIYGHSGPDERDVFTMFRLIRGDFASMSRLETASGSIRERTYSRPVDHRCRADRHARSFSRTVSSLATDGARLDGAPDGDQPTDATGEASGSGQEAGGLGADCENRRNRQGWKI